VSLLVQDPLDPEACQVSCEQIVSVDPQPPCNIDGDLSVCVGSTKTYSTTVNGVPDVPVEETGRLVSRGGDGAGRPPWEFCMI
jgi:hypothetical protein